MTLHTTGERTLEKYSIFPYVAWATFVGFAIFVYGITVQLNEATVNLSESTKRLQTVVDSNLSEVEDFEIRN
ncbi:MAG: hypothetical protein AAGA35_04210 [Patescibacteria group bacterium]